MVKGSLNTELNVLIESHADALTETLVENPKPQDFILIRLAMMKGAIIALGQINDMEKRYPTHEQPSSVIINNNNGA